MTSVPGLRFHIQNFSSTCGPATAMTVLSQFGEMPDDAHQLQWMDHPLVPPTWVDKPFAQSHDGTSPTELAHLLVARDPGGAAAGRAWEVVISESAEDLLAYLCEAIDRAIAQPDKHAAPVALVRGLAHWVVVSGYHQDETGVRGLIVLDPSRFKEVDDEQMVHRADDACGSGMVVVAGNPPDVIDWGTPHHVVCAGEWRDRQMTGFRARPDGEAEPRHIYLAVGTTDSPGGPQPRWLPESEGTYALAAPFPARAQTVPTAQAAVALAMAQLQAFPFGASGINATDDLIQALRDANPVLHRAWRVGYAGSAFRYWLVTLLVDYRIGLALTLDVKTGELLELFASVTGDVVTKDIAAHTTKKASFVNLAVKLADGSYAPVSTALMSADIADMVELIYVPDQSPSPLLPFLVTYEVDQANQPVNAEAPIMVRSDGALFQFEAGLPDAGHEWKLIPMLPPLAWTLSEDVVDLNEIVGIEPGSGHGFDIVHPGHNHPTNANPINDIRPIENLDH